MRVLMSGLSSEAQRKLSQLFGKLSNPQPLNMVSEKLADESTLALRLDQVLKGPRLTLAVLQERLRKAQSEFEQARSASTHGSELDALSDRCTAARNAINQFASEFGSVQISTADQLDVGSIGTQDTAFVLVGGNCERDPSGKLKLLSAHGIFTLSIYPNEWSQPQIDAFTLKSLGRAAAVMSEETLIRLFEPIVTRRDREPQLRTIQWLPHSLELLLRQRI